MTPNKIAIRYTLIAVTASVTNLLLQFLFLRVYSSAYAVELSIAVATALVLPLKYLADKRLIFGFDTQSHRHNVSTFLMYSLVSVFTVAEFWGCEYAFHLAFDSDALRYIGGAIGLALSFFMKYRLDKRFVVSPGR